MTRAIGIAGIALLASAAALAWAPAEARAQRWWGERDRYENYRLPERDIFPGQCFTFCRLQYNSHGGGRRGWRGSWRTDYPESDLNFPTRLEELTTIKVCRDENGNIKHAIVDLLDDDLFKYPFLYALEVGDLYFTEEEAGRLREYLLRGGFLLVDDFWGSREWANWEYEFSKVFDPKEYPMVDIPLEHEIFHIVFELDEMPQIPGIGHWYNSGGDTSERWHDSAKAECKGVFDKRGRLMAVILHNTDLGDGWEEEAKNPDYFHEFSKKKAYPLGINIVVYAMTH